MHYDNNSSLVSESPLEDSVLIPPLNASPTVASCDFQHINTTSSSPRHQSAFNSSQVQSLCSSDAVPDFKDSQKVKRKRATSLASPLVLQLMEMGFSRSKVEKAIRSMGKQ